MSSRSTVQKFIDEMRMTTKDIGVADSMKLHSQWVRRVYCGDIYLRRGPVYINEERTEDVITIANISIPERYQDTGRFSALVKGIQAEGCGVYVENVLTEEFEAKLKHLNFVRVNAYSPPHYYLEAPQ